MHSLLEKPRTRWVQFTAAICSPQQVRRFAASRRGAASRWLFLPPAPGIRTFERCRAVPTERSRRYCLAIAVLLGSRFILQTF